MPPTRIYMPEGLPKAPHGGEPFGHAPHQDLLTKLSPNQKSPRGFKGAHPISYFFSILDTQVPTALHTSE
eukprot:3139588-Prymnesium_polylepis.1